MILWRKHAWNAVLKRYSEEFWPNFLILTIITRTRHTGIKYLRFTDLYQSSVLLRDMDSSFDD